jgi:hypothetical protein
MTNNQNPTMTHAERLALYSAARLDTPPIMPAVVRRPPPKPRRNSVKHRAIR